MDTKIKTFLFLLILVQKISADEKFYPAIQTMINPEDRYTDLAKLVESIILKVNVSHCYAFITDRIHEDILRSRLFHLTEGRPIIMLRLKESQDPFAENPITDQILLKIREDQCELYVILLANGIQTERFLRYGEKYRLLTTAAKFLMLHDFRLFLPEMHYIWRRIVNVVFLRQDFERESFKAGRLWELSTVPFPAAIKGVFAPKILDTWRGGYFRRRTRLFPDKSRSLNGEMMKTVVLDHTPGVLRNDSGDNMTYSGLEIQILRALGQGMNFTPDFYETNDTDTSKWGQLGDNDTYSGLLGEMDNGLARFAIADLYYTFTNLDLMDLSYPYTEVCLTFLTPEALTDNSWQTLILPFQADMWAGVLVILFCISFVFYAFAKFYIYMRPFMIKEPEENVQNDKKRKRKPRFFKDIYDDFMDCVTCTYSMLLVVSLPDFPRNWGLRILTGWYWIYCILVVVAYRASMTAILSNPPPKLTIETLAELADANIGVGAWGEQNKKFFLDADDPLIQKIGKRLEHIDDPDTAVGKVAAGLFAYYENVDLLKRLRSKNKDESSLAVSLHVMSECVVRMPFGIGLEKNSPLVARVDRYIRWMVESGLIEKWRSDVVKQFESSVSDPPKLAVMDFRKFYGAMVVLLIGYVLAALALIGEKLYWKFVVMRHPLYNEYNMRGYYEALREKK